MSRREINAITGEETVDEGWVAPALPAAPPPTPVPALFAVAQLSIADGEISGIGLVSRFSAAMWMDVGSYYIFFAETLPDTSYVAKAYRDGNAFALSIAEKAEDYIVVTATDAEGAPADPPDVTIEIIRIL